MAIKGKYRRHFARAGKYPTGSPQRKSAQARIKYKLQNREQRFKARAWWRVW